MAEYDIIDHGDFDEILVQIPRAIVTEDGPVVALSSISSVSLMHYDQVNISLEVRADGETYVVKSWPAGDASTYVKAVKKANRKARKLRKALGWDVFSL